MISHWGVFSCAVLVAVAACICVADVAFSESHQKFRLGRVMWSAFQCSTYAELSKDQDEQARLFQDGYRTGAEFIEAVASKEISVDEIRSGVPIGVGMNLAGPSADFIIGRIFENAMRDAYDSIVREDSAGMPLEINEWVRDDEIKEAKARTEYLKSNCELIR